MGSSFVEFRNKGFWSWDGYLEDVLSLLATTPIDLPDPAWLVSARKEWLLHGSGGFTGCIRAGLDDFLTTEGRRQIFFRLIEAVQNRSDLTSEATATLTLLIGLVRGELTTDASSPLDYMVSGDEFPYRGVLRSYP